MRDKQRQGTIPGDELLTLIAEAAHARKGHDIVALDVRELVYYTDYFLICTGRTDRHVRGLRKHIEKVLLDQGVRPLNLEGGEHNRWVLMDFGAVIVHLFYEPLRDLYELEKLWGDAPRMELQLRTPPPEEFEEDEDLADEEEEGLFPDFE